MTKYTAEVTLQVLIEFEDDGELDLFDQAHEAAQYLVDSSILWDCTVKSVNEVTD